MNHIILKARKVEYIESFRAKESQYTSSKKPKISDSINLSTSVEKLFNKFSGLSEYLKQLFLKRQLKKQKMNQDENYEKQKKKKQQEEENQSTFALLCNFFMKLLHFTFLIAFAYLSMYSTSNKEPDEKAFLMRKVANDIIQMPDISKSNDNKLFSSSIISHMYNQLKLLSNHTTYFSFTMITPIRFTFVCSY